MMTNAPPILFDTAQLRKQHHRASADFAQHNFLFLAAAERLSDRLLDINRHFETAADISARGRILSNMLQGFPRIGTLITCSDSARDTPNIVSDTALLPFAENSLDAILSIGALHWVNDLPGLLAQAIRALKPDGLFMATLAGATSLQELRESLAHGESHITGGISPRISPFLDIRDAGALLQRAGFALPVVDAEPVTVSYGTMFALCKDLRGMGETSAMKARPKHFMRRDVFAAASAHYAAQHSDTEGRITATIEFLTLTAWKPAVTQQQPLKRGSAKHSLKTALS
jgi:NADH dehydrogenase [ubiquinone] 1 alpha subcomplex assembly factor 5